MTRKGSKLVSGTDLKVGDKTLGFGVIVQVSLGQLQVGAKYLDATFADNSEHRCWEGFRYHVECKITKELA